VLEAIGQHPVLCLITSLLSIFMTLMVQSFTKTFSKIRDYKYGICKEIEGSLGMQPRPHTDVDKHYSTGLQKKWYAAATTAFVFVWLCAAAASIYFLCGPRIWRTFL
jgi:hypothetical protein